MSFASEQSSGVELARGYIALTAKYSPAMQQIAKDFQALESEAGKAGLVAGQKIASGISAGTKDAVQPALKKELAETGRGVAKESEAVGRKIGSGVAGGVEKTLGRELKDTIKAEMRAAGVEVETDAQMYGALIGRTIGNSIRAPIAASFATARFGLGELESATRHVSGSIGGSLRSAFSMAGPMAAMSAVATGIFSLGEGIRKGFEIRETLEEAEIRMRSLGMSAADVEEVFSDLNAALKGTKYGVEEAAGAAEKLATMGIRGEELTKYLKDAANVAALTGTSIDDAANIFLRWQDEIKAGSRDLKALTQQDLPQLVKWLEQDLNVDEDTLYEMFKKGQIGYQNMMDAIDKHTAGVAVNMSKTIGSQMHKAAESIGEIFSKVMQPFFGNADGPLGKLNGWLSNVSAGIGQPGVQAGIGSTVHTILDDSKQFVRHMSSSGLGTMAVGARFGPWGALAGLLLDPIRSLLAGAAPNLFGEGHALGGGKGGVGDTSKSFAAKYLSGEALQHAFGNVLHAVDNFGHARVTCRTLLATLGTLLGNIVHAFGNVGHASACDPRFWKCWACLWQCRSRFWKCWACHRQCDARFGV